jgi:hypothetical protein
VLQEEDEEDASAVLEELEDNSSKVSEHTEPTQKNQGPQQEKKLMSRKTQSVLHHIKRLEKQLQDQSIINEIEEVLGKGSNKIVRDLKDKLLTTRDKSDLEDGNNMDEGINIADAKMVDTFLETKAQNEEEAQISHAPDSTIVEPPEVQRQVTFAMERTEADKKNSPLSEIRPLR